MLYKGSWHFLLGLILLMVFYRNVKSNELNEVGGTRRNIFDNIIDFFKKNFKPRISINSRPSRTTPLKKKTTSVKPKTVKKKPKPVYYVHRRMPKLYMNNINDELPSYLIEETKKKPGINETDIISENPGMYIFLDSFGKLFKILFKTYKDHILKRSDDNGENYVRSKGRINSNDLKTLIILVTNEKKVREEITAKEDLSYLSVGKSYTSDVLNQTILREAYGVACIKVAIRKCYKTLRRVNDIVCRTLFKCKSNFKSMFLLKAKRGCITGFDYTAVSSQKSVEIEIKYNSRALGDKKRKKYIDACIPYIMPENSNTIRKQIHLGNNLTHIVKQILRDQSDRKCIKVSREACVTACKYARDEVCSTYVCGRQKTKAFSRECKNECKSSYAIQSDSSDSGNDSD